MDEKIDIDFLTGFGKKLKKIREESDLSFRKLAAKCNVDHSDIAKMEKGEINITLKTLLELANGLDVHPKELIDFVFNPEL